MEAQLRQVSNSQPGNLRISVSVAFRCVREEQERGLLRVSTPFLLAYAVLLSLAQ